MLFSSSLRRIAAKRFLHNTKCFFSNTKVLLEEESGRLSSATHRVNQLEKKFLVWTGKYKAVEQVPDYVAPDVVERARNRMRIRIANIMMIMTAIACFFIMKSGKKARDEGESLTKRSLEWHQQLKDEAIKEKSSN